ncbi:conserved hypothetical protein (plasmid) [Borreliella afzelii ACA-1]|uniref:hypothetical protein n=2 Tax=Borreliella afzelii TaxID=29518 RepID=UPI00016B306A|nr:conserved hypothetical protein [Borreliella afzelii ACA-1]
MDAVKKIHELLDSVEVKNSLIKGLESSFGSEKANIVSEGITFTSSLLRLVFFLRSIIEKNNEDKAAVEHIDKRLKETLDLSVKACKTFVKSGGDFAEYDKLIRLRNEATVKMLKSLQEKNSENQVQGG